MDKWESYIVNFSIYYPIDQDEYMRINGETKALGDWNRGHGPMCMEESEEEVVWLTG